MQTVEHFFHQYANAYIKSELESFAQLISLPSMLLAGESKTLLTDTDSLNSYILSRVAHYHELGVVNVDYVLQHQLRLSEQMQFVSIKWRFFNIDNEQLFSCHTSYTLQLKLSCWQVVAIILDDEDTAYHQLVQHQA